MNAPPDLSTLPQRVRYAVNGILQEVFDKDDVLSEQYGMALMCDLLDAASKWEREEREAAQREALVEELAQRVYETYQKVALRAPDWESAGTGKRDHSRIVARHLIESGWRKGDPV